MANALEERYVFKKAYRADNDVERIVWLRNGVTASSVAPAGCPYNRSSWISLFTREKDSSVVYFGLAVYVCGALRSRAAYGG